jgi:putative ABC transport system permease protein
MKPALTMALADVRRHRLQTLVVFVIAALAITVGALGGTLLVQTSSPYDHAFANLAGPHVVAVFDSRKATASQVAATAGLASVTGTAGPWVAAEVPFEKGGTHLTATGSFTQKSTLTVLGRDDPGGRIDRLEVVGGRWVRGPGEIVVTRSFAIARAVRVGDRITALGTADKAVITVVGEAVDVDPNPDRAWVASGVVATLNPVGAPLTYVMAYRFRAATTRSDIRTDLSALEAAVPAGAVASYSSYLDFRDAYNFNNSLILTFLLAFAVLAVGAVAVIVANVVTGAVLANYREIGILKAIGFTPRQVVAVFVIQMLVPALAACLVGVPLGAIASKPLLDQAAQAVSLPPPSPLAPVVDVLVAALGVGIIAAAAATPAWRASRMNAVDAIAAGTAPLGRYARRRVGLWWVPGQLTLGAGDAFARPVRGVLTAVAILVGVATLVFASGLYSSILKFNELFAQPNFQVTVSRLGGYSDLATNDVLQRQPDTNLIVGVRQLAAAVPGQPDPVTGTIFSGRSQQLGYRLAEGRWFAKSGEAVLGVVSNPYHWHVGQEVPVRIEGEDVRLRIVGTCYCFWTLGMDWSSYSAIASDAQPTDYLVQLHPGSNVDAYVRRVSAAQPDSLFPQAISSGTGFDIEAVLNAMVAALALILGAIAALGVFNALLLTTRERVRDIAILKALGMTPGQVSSMVTTSAAVLGLVGAALGIPAGIALYRYLIDAMAHLAGFSVSSDTFISAIDPARLMLVALAGVLVAVLGAILPARWAARTSVVGVLNLE